MTESLFSLEIHIESLSDVKVSCCIPAISYRLLDFPSLIIHHVPPKIVDNLREKAKLTSASRNPVFPELRDRNGNFLFKKGKSCLFKVNINKLHQQLQVTPVYVMLVDLWPKRPKLIGSTVVPLKSAVDKIKADVQIKGLSVPSFAKAEGTFDVYNLMGSSIGKVNLGFRLLSLGGTLIPHIPCESLMKEDKPAGKSSEEIDIPEVVPEESKKACEEEEIPQVLEKQNIQQDSQTQTELIPTKSKPAKHHKESIPDYNDILITNTVCPPPLFYNCQSYSENTGKKEVAEQVRHELLADTSPDVDYGYYEPGILQPDGTLGCASVMVQTEAPTDTTTDFKVLKDSSESSNVNMNLENMPLLRALVKEISQLNADGEKDNGHMKPDKTIVEKENLQKPPGSPRKCVACEEQVTVEKSKGYKQPSAVASRKQKPNSLVEMKKRVKFRKTSLTYGMTKTQLMRLKMNQKALPENARPVNVVDIKGISRARRDNIQAVNTATADFGRTQVIVPLKNAESQTDQVEVEQTSANLGGTVVITGQTLAHSKDSQLGSSRSLVSQNSLEVYLPHMIQDSDANSSESDVPLPPPRFSKYGNTGIESPPPAPKPVPRPRSNTINSPVVRSRASTALSMYSDDFEESNFENASEDTKSDTSSVLSYHSVKSQSRSSIASQPQRSNASPIKAKKHGNNNKAKTSSSSTSSSSTRSNSQKRNSASDNPLKGNATVTLHSDHSTASMHKPENASTYSEEFHSVASDSGSDGSNESVIESRHVWNLPKPASDLGYTY